MILKKIDDPHHNEAIEEFLLKYAAEIDQHFSTSATISKYDIGTMMIAFEFFGMDSRIPKLFHL